MNMSKNDKLEKLLWSIAFPGFGQVLNQKYVKGFFFIILEIVINVQANFNQIIVFSFHGNIDLAIKQADYSWLMFYPCLYCFAVWDAYKDAQGKTPILAFLPFLGAASFVTIGLIISPIFQVSGIRLGPVWLPILFLIPGIGIGLFLRSFLIKLNRKSSYTDDYSI